MTQSLEALRSHEAALLAWARTAAFQQGAYANYEARLSAYEYLLGHVRDEIAKAEDEVKRAAERCTACRGTGEVFSWSSLTDETECGNCRGSGRKAP